MDEWQRDLLSEYVKKMISEQSEDVIKNNGYIDLVFTEDDIEVLSIFKQKPVEDKIIEVKNILNRVLNKDIDVCIHGFDDEYIKISRIGAENVGKLVKIRAIVNATTPIKPVCQSLELECNRCHNTFNLPQTDPFKLIVYNKCPMQDGDKICGGKLKVNYDNSAYKDSQKIIVQEIPEDVSKQIPSSKELMIYNKMFLDVFKSGDWIDAIGVVKIKPNNNPNMNKFTDTYIEAYNIIPKHKDADISKLSKDEVLKIKELVNTHGYRTLVENVAPNIIKMDVEKEAALLSLIGGVEHSSTDRYWINVLLAGDPSVAKSQILIAAANIAPIGVYSGGKGLSAAGLTSAVVKEKGSEVPMLMAGLLPLCNKGIAAIDEFDKVSSDDVKSIHGAMENGIVSVDKGGFRTSLMSKTAVLAAANPSFGKYDVNRTFGENMKSFPIPLLTRFDLMFICLDDVDESKDRKIAKRMMKNDNEEDKLVEIDRELMKNYIFYAKSLTPTMSSEIKSYIEDYYIGIRKRQNREDPTPITHRQLASIIRLAEAHAKALLKNEVDMDDAIAAIRLVDISLEQTCRVINSDGITVINTANIEFQPNNTTKFTMIYDCIKKSGEFGMTEDEIFDTFKGVISMSEIQKYISQMNNKIYDRNCNGRWRAIK